MRTHQRKTLSLVLMQILISPTKCIIFMKKKKSLGHVYPVKLNGDALPWVNQVKHLGHTLEVDNSMTTVIIQKRDAFIGRINSLMHYASPRVMLRLAQSYACNMAQTLGICSHQCATNYIRVLMLHYGTF